MKVVSRVSVLTLLALATSVLSVKGCGGGAMTTMVQQAPQTVYTTQPQPVAAGCGGGQVVSQMQSAPVAATGCGSQVVTQQAPAQQVVYTQAPAQEVVYTQPAGGCATQQASTQQVAASHEQTSCSHSAEHTHEVAQTQQTACAQQQAPAQQVVYTQPATTGCATGGQQVVTQQATQGCGAGQVHSVVAAQQPVVVTTQTQPASTLGKNSPPNNP